MRATLLLLAFTAACGPATPKLDTDTGEITGPDEEELEAEWGEARLEILQPLSGDFLPWEEDNSFEAVVYDSEGNATDFSEISWTSSVDGEWAGAGAAFEDDSLDVGVHTLTATAELPNGDRLVYAVGGVLVQSAYAGTYTGTLSIDAAYDTYQVGCSGAALLYVDAYGELIDGNAGCSISLQGFDLDLAYLISGDNIGGEVAGTAAVDIFGFEVPMDMRGELSEEGQFSAEFAGDAYVEIAGTLDLTRISRETIDIAE